MYVVAFNGSGRKDGNTAILTEFSLDKLLSHSVPSINIQNKTKFTYVNYNQVMMDMLMAG